MSERTNSDIHLRPRFSIDFDKNKQVLLDRFEEKLKCTDCKYKIRIIDNHVVLDVPQVEDHFWSPQLHLEIEDIENNKSIVKGLFGPKSQVWTFFMFVHFGLAIGFIGFLILLYTRWRLETNTLLPIIMIVFIILVWIALYFLGSEGKKKGRPQMNELYNFMKEILGK